MSYTSKKSLHENSITEREKYLAETATGKGYTYKCILKARSHQPVEPKFNQLNLLHSAFNLKSNIFHKN